MLGSAKECQSVRVTWQDCANVWQGVLESVPLDLFEVERGEDFSYGCLDNQFFCSP